MTMDIRVRLRPWLESRLNEGWIEGLNWIDHEKGIFRIPWKHHSKHTWTEQDATIFKDWAVVTGRYREGIDDPDWPMWKTRLRCALNKAPDIQEVKQRHNLHCDEPFKVYRFISKTESLWRANASRNASMIFDGIPAMANPPPLHLSSVVRRSMQPTTLLGGKRPAFFIRRLVRPASGCRPIAVLRRAHDQLFLKKLSLRAQAQPAPVEQSPAFSISETADSLDVGAVQEITGFSEESAAFNRQSWQPYANRGVQPIPLPPSILRKVAPMHGASYQSPGYDLANGNSQSFLPLLPDVMEPEFHQLGVRIQHLNIRVKDSIVTNPNGCCIYFGRYDEASSSAVPDAIEAQIIRHVSDANRSYVNLLLDNMYRGVIVTSSRGSIYVERLCKCAVFVYAPSGGDYVFLKNLSRKECTKVFDYSQFMADLEYHRRRQGPRPQFEIVLSFGQQLRPGVSTDSLLVWCRIASCRAWFQAQKASAEFPKLEEGLSNGIPLHQPPQDAEVNGGRPLDCDMHVSYRNESTAFDKNPYDPSYVRIGSSASADSIAKMEDMDGGIHTADTLNLADGLPDRSSSSELVIEEGVEIPLDDQDHLNYEAPGIHEDDLLQNMDGDDLESRHAEFMNAAEGMDIKPYISEDTLLNLGTDFKS
ncbi:interferon regulatory factor [Sparganum proliferum]